MSRKSSWYNIAEISSRYNVSQDMVIALISDGYIEATCPNSRIASCRVHTSALDRFLEEGGGFPLEDEEEEEE
jgi:hypothetical protein